MGFLLWTSVTYFLTYQHFCFPSCNQDSEAMPYHLAPLESMNNIWHKEVSRITTIFVADCSANPRKIWLNCKQQSSCKRDSTKSNKVNEPQLNQFDITMPFPEELMLHCTITVHTIRSQEKVIFTRLQHSITTTRNPLLLWSSRLAYLVFPFPWTEVIYGIALRVQKVLPS